MIARYVVFLLTHSHYHIQVMERVQRGSLGYLQCQEVRQVYEAGTTAQSRTSVYTSPGIILDKVTSN